MAVLYHVRLAQDVVHGEKVDVPYFAPQTASASLERVTPAAAAAGLQSGDTLVAINGRPYTGTAILAEESAKAQPGTSLAVTVRSAKTGAPKEHKLQRPVTSTKSQATAVGNDRF